MRRVAAPDLVEDLLFHVTSDDPKRVVDAAFALQCLQAKVRNGLVDARTRLRALAGASGGVVAGLTARARVEPASPVVRVRRGSEGALRRALGDRFGEFFRVVEVVEPVRSSVPDLLALPPEVRDVVFACLDVGTDDGAVHLSAR